MGVRTESDESVTVVHWTTGHLLQEEATDLHLLDDMAEDFNSSDHRTADGKRIEVKVYYASGATQAPEITARVTRGCTRRKPGPARPDAA